MLPAKADPHVQAEYLTNEMEPRLAEAQAGQRAVFFVDAAHFVMSAFLGYLWCLTRIFYGLHLEGSALMYWGQSMPLQRN